MVRYVEGCLNALGIRYGAMHTEVKLEARGPVLVEVNCRLHGAEGLWLPLAEKCFGGITQVTCRGSPALSLVHPPQALHMSSMAR